jgi:hypothetical protein
MLPDLQAYLDTKNAVGSDEIQQMMRMKITLSVQRTLSVIPGLLLIVIPAYLDDEKCSGFTWSVDCGHLAQNAQMPPQ